MSVQIQNKTYSNPYRPEEVSFFINNVGEWNKLKFEVSVGVRESFGEFRQVYIEGKSTIIISTLEDWEDLGFFVGDSFVMEWRERTLSSTGAILTDVDKSVTGTVLTIDNNSLTLDTDINTFAYSIFPTQYLAFKIDEVVCYVDKLFKEVHVQYNHTEGGGDVSVIDSTVATLNFRGLETMSINDVVNLSYIGDNSGMSIEGGTVKYLSENLNIKTYEVELLYLVSAFKDDSTVFPNIPPSYYKKDNALSDKIKVSFFPEVGNYGVFVSSETKSSFSNTGWLSENYNGGNTDVVVTSLVYEDVLSGEQVQQLSYNQDTKIIVEIENASNLVIDDTLLSYCFVWLPQTETLYKDLKTPQHINLKVNTNTVFTTLPLNPSPPAVTFNGFSNNGARIDVINPIFKEVGTKLVFEAVFSPTSEFSTYFETLEEFDKNYLFTISTADHEKTTNESDRVSVYVDYNTLEKYVPEAGSYDELQTSLFTLGEDGSGTENACLDLFLEDSLLTVFDYRVNPTERTLQSLEVALEVENTITKEIYQLEDRVINLLDSPIVSGVQIPNIEELRGYNLPSGDNKNIISLQRDSTTDDLGVNLYGYKLKYPFRLRWEDWIAKTGVPDDFYNTALPNNGQSEDWKNYISGSWVFYITCYSTYNEGGELVRYRNTKSIFFNDINSNNNLTVNTEIYRLLDNTLIADNIIKDEIVRLECTYTYSSGVFDFANTFTEVCIGEKQGAGTLAQWRINTFDNVESVNPLQPIDGETKLKITLVSPNVIKSECLIDGSKLENQNGFRLSTRIGCK